MTTEQDFRKRNTKYLEKNTKIAAKIWKHKPSKYRMLEKLLSISLYISIKLSIILFLIIEVFKYQYHLEGRFDWWRFGGADEIRNSSLIAENKSLYFIYKKMISEGHDLNFQYKVKCAERGAGREEPWNIWKEEQQRVLEVVYRCICHQWIGTRDKYLYMKLMPPSRWQCDKHSYRDFSLSGKTFTSYTMRKIICWPVDWASLLSSDEGKELGSRGGGAEKASSRQGILYAARTLWWGGNALRRYISVYLMASTFNSNNSLEGTRHRGMCVLEESHETKNRSFPCDWTGERNDILLFRKGDKTWQILLPGGG